MNIHIKSISATAGFLENCTVELDKGLNCIIGARGTCKSTLIESIRYVFNSNTNKIDNLLGKSDAKGEPSFGLLQTTLGAGSLRCEIFENNAEDVTSLYLEREIGSDTRIYQDGVREHSNFDMLHKIEIFSQGDLQRIAEDSDESLRISLIDRPNFIKINKLKQDRIELANQLFDVGTQLRNIKNEITSIKQQLQPAAALKEELKIATQTCPTLSPELEKHRLLYEKRISIIESLVELNSIKNNIMTTIDSLNPLESQLNYFANKINENIEESPESLVFATSILTELSKIIKSGKALRSYDVDKHIADMKQVFEEKNDDFYKLRQEQQEVNESLKRQQLLKKQLEHMAKLEKEQDLLQASERSNINKRQEIRAKLNNIDNTIYELRINEIDIINKEFGDTVYLTLDIESGTTSYYSRLCDMLTGSRIRTQEEVAAIIIKAFSPSMLIDIIESGNSQILSNVLNRDLGQMNRVVAHLADHPDLYSLETHEPGAKLEITMFQEGIPKPVETLSKGQKATALLPLILRPLPYPLLIDQPEDDLDNSFIYSSLVKSVKELKHKRQLIFVTHNANIPVLGDADRVVVMSMSDPSRADVPKFGSVEERKYDILNLLEGGAEAFKERESRYHDILNEN
ncbi:AAA family ATPase [Oryzomonas japonica]|uniref:AAA family ATPase n=1 Tax=Oryzomonas japonica TaxID=2603858 RepID=A0A7J4ZVP2_9BACT|nr:AAA family ATPase [Oryzomonas japonica]KAB0667657.1 AAA family ATPase [Oryzomonas japonica]